MRPLEWAGLGLLGGLWNQQNPQGFDAAAGNLRQGLMERERQRLAAQQRQDEMDWRQRQEERWDEDRRSRIQQWIAEQEYQQGRDKVNDAHDQSLLTEDRRQFDATQADRKADNERMAGTEARRVREWNAENYGYPWGSAEQAQVPAAAALNVVLGGAMPQARGLLPQVQPQQVDVGRPAQSYMNKVATERATQGMGDYRDLNNQFLQETMGGRIDSVALRNEGQKLLNELRAIDVETRPEVRAAQLQALRQRIAMYPLQQQALMALIQGRQIDNKWAGVLNLHSALSGGDYQLNPEALTGFGGQMLPVAPNTGNAGVPSTTPGLPTPRPGPNAMVVPRSPTRNVDGTQYERLLPEAQASGLDVDTWKTFKGLGIAPGPQASATFDFYHKNGLIDHVMDGDEETDQYVIDRASPWRENFANEQRRWTTGVNKWVNGQTVRTDAPKPKAAPKPKPKPGKKPVPKKTGVATVDAL